MPLCQPDAQLTPEHYPCSQLLTANVLDCSHGHGLLKQLVAWSCPGTFSTVLRPPVPLPAHHTHTATITDACRSLTNWRLFASARTATQLVGTVLQDMPSSTAHALLCVTTIMCALRSQAMWADWAWPLNGFSGFDPLYMSSPHTHTHTQSHAVTLPVLQDLSPASVLSRSTPVQWCWPSIQRAQSR